MFLFCVLFNFEIKDAEFLHYAFGSSFHLWYIHSLASVKIRSDMREKCWLVCHARIKMFFYRLFVHDLKCYRHSFLAIKRFTAFLWYFDQYLKKHISIADDELANPYLWWPHQINAQKKKNKLTFHSYKLCNAWVQFEVYISPRDTD